MIRSNEIRMGNYVKWQSTNIHIKNHNLFNRSIRKINEDRCFGIELTEEWLIKFGFLSNDNCRYKNKFEIYLQGVQNENGKIEVGFYFLGFNNEIKYVHQLQNLYFSLTMEELEISL